MSRRRKSHPSDWVVVAVVVVLAWGVLFGNRLLIISGIAGVFTLIFGWIAFRNTVICDVKLPSRPGYCRRKVKGALFGCQNHRWEKVFAWMRYLGLGYAARKVLHSELPILRWQAGAEQIWPRTVAAVPHTATTIPALESVDTEPAQPGMPVPAVQGLSIYLGVLSSVAGLVSFGLGIIQIVKGSP